MKTFKNFAEEMEASLVRTINELLETEERHPVIHKNMDVKSALDAYRKTGRVAFHHPKKKTVSLNGGKHMPERDAVAHIAYLFKRNKG